MPRLNQPRQQPQPPKIHLFRVLTGLAVGFMAGAGLVTYYWWLSDQKQAEALDGWEWQPRIPIPTDLAAAQTPNS